MEETLLAKHQAFIRNAKTTGRHVLSFNTPCCDRPLETLAPTDARETWDSLTTCPHCGLLFMKVVTSESARGVLPPSREG